MKTNIWRGKLTPSTGGVRATNWAGLVVKTSALLILLLHEAVSSPAQNVQFTVLHSFTNNPDGASPSGCLVEGSDGAIYGATESGGTNVGTFYKIYKNGDGYAKLADLNLNSYQPAGGLLQASNGLIYGVTTGYGIGG